MEKKYNASRLFVASCLALLVTSLTFAIRAKIEGVFSSDYGLTGQQVGRAFGPAFWGFTIAMYIGGLIIDVVKIRRIIWFAFAAHFIGIILLLMAKDMTTLLISNIFIGLGNGSVEAACNPLIATIYSDNKTKMLNRFHVWFSGGLVIGGILAWLLVDKLDISWYVLGWHVLSWHVLTALLFIPLALYGYLFMGQVIPETERLKSGVSYKDMLKNVAAPITIIIVVFFMIVAASFPTFIKIDFTSIITYIVMGVILIAVIVEGLIINKVNLLFPFMVFCMFLTASTELGTSQWINALLEKSGINPMIILVVVTGIMAVGRFFAGPLIHKLNPSGVLLGSAIFSVIGLYLLSIADGAAFTMFAAVIFAFGVCYFWPTMLGFVSEYIPKSGALGLSIMGGAGMVATSLVLPIMGKSMDLEGPKATLHYMTLLPAILVAGFIFLTLYIRKRK